MTTAGIDPDPYSAHSLRAGFITYTSLRARAIRPSPINHATDAWRAWTFTGGSNLRGPILPRPSSVSRSKALAARCQCPDPLGPRFGWVRLHLSSSPGREAAAGASPSGHWVCLAQLREAADVNVEPAPRG